MAKNMTTISEFVGRLRLGTAQQCRNMTVIPLFHSEPHGVTHLTLQEAIERNLLSVTEVHQQGSVPDLKATNLADTPVLLLEGEELVGAKQNRVLNTSVLIKEKSEVVIPVSCTEHGRWGYSSAKFFHAEHFSSSTLRKLKWLHVTRSLKASGKYSSDQGAIWGEVGHMLRMSGTRSPTSAMHDVFLAKESDLADYLRTFRHEENQKGLLVFINGQVAGLDLVSYQPAYRVLHGNLIRGFAIDALLQQKSHETRERIELAAARFFEDTRECKETVHRSVGCGFDHRLEGPKVIGSALLAEGSVVHLSLFGRN